MSRCRMTPRSRVRPAGRRPDGKRPLADDGELCAGWRRRAAAYGADGADGRARVRPGTTEHHRHDQAAGLTRNANATTHAESTVAVTSA